MCTSSSGWHRAWRASRAIHDRCMREGETVERRRPGGFLLHVCPVSMRAARRFVRELLNFSFVITVHRVLLVTPRNESLPRGTEYYELCGPDCFRLPSLPRISYSRWSTLHRTDYADYMMVFRIRMRRVYASVCWLHDNAPLALDHQSVISRPNSFVFSQSNRTRKRVRGETCLTT